MRSDDETLAALRGGDEQVFVELVQQHHALMLRVASRYVRSRAIAEEVVQETWLGVLNGLDRFEGRAAVATATPAAGSASPSHCPSSACSSGRRSR